MFSAHSLAGRGVSAHEHGLAGLDAMDRRALKVIKLEWVLFGQRANRRRRWRRCGGALAEHVVFFFLLS